MSVGVVASILISGLWTGALARFAVPGPDPMPIWLTTAIGLVGSIIGALVAKALFNGNAYVISFGSLGVAIALVLAYRRFIQKRPLTGEGARAFPQRGFGIDQARERLGKLGLDPDSLTHRPSQPRETDQDRHRAMLDELHRAGILDDAEHTEKTRALGPPQGDT